MNSPDTVAIEFGSASNNDAEHSKPSLTPENDTASSPPFKRKTVSKAALVNKLNFLNFSDRPLTVNLTHSRYGTPLSLLAQPLPCSGERLDCLWLDPPNSMTLNNHQFCNITINEGRKCLIIVPQMAIIDTLGISLNLPATGLENTARKTYRHACRDILAQFTQNGAVYSGVLSDLNPSSFRVHISSPHSNHLQWLNHELPVNLQLLANNQMIYTGECRFVRTDSNGPLSSFVLTPTTSIFQRFKPKKYRSNRLKLVPSPIIAFNHPLTSKKVHLNVMDLSGSGFSVEERSINSLLFPGLIIPRLELKFSQKFSIACRAQVIYRTGCPAEQQDTVKCGMTILDMDMQDHVSLLSLLQQTENRHSFIDASVDMDMLWSFFFESGFIYPSKYVSLQDSKDDIKSTFEKLYNHCPSIARHFTHKRKGEILAHMSMVRFYENAWLIHHHAANKSESMVAGIEVLKQTGNYINEVHRLNSAHMGYVFSYFRPENRFPNRIFGGFARQLNNNEGSSLDTFSFMQFPSHEAHVHMLPETWKLTRTRPEDFDELRRFYQFSSGGLMLDAFDLQPGPHVHTELSREYNRLGFKKNRYIDSLLANGDLKAVFITENTEIGFNMTNLTNCTTVFVLDEATPRRCLEAALAEISQYYAKREMPVLVYPARYAEQVAFPGTKTYCLWILSMKYTDQYFRYTGSLFSQEPKPRAQSLDGTTAEGAAK